ncbi:BatA domain-containing protein [Hymenobacter sp. BT175]|uniref:BatA domain-containing protein n=1 Tax=Hymenobacter translucens TaxID=2886507 RepID=UPI001D0F38C4|nr:BatA domain-containing protein [Hymenobacter translucens]MCC2545953.1 BatA domain-containing protein [Hymenobacter translucens]
MFTLLNISGLLALLGLLVPVAIHLWNRRPARKVAVGSLRWLTEGANRRLRQLQLEQFFLLLLRAALVGLLALAAAAPGWRFYQPGSRGQVLMEPGLLRHPGFEMVRGQLDSLRRRGYEVRYLARGFRLISAAARAADSTAGPYVDQFPTTDTSLFLWARARQAADSFPNQPLHLLTTSALRNFQGSHAPLPARVTWQTLPPGSAVWLQSAAGSGPDSLRLLIGRSSPTGTVFRRLSVSRPRDGGLVRLPGLPPLRYRSSSTVATLTPEHPNGEKAAAVQVQTKPLRIGIYADSQHGPDARYLKAALQAAALGVAVPVVVQTSPNPPLVADSLRWLFWLAEAPVPAAWLGQIDHGLRLWQDARGPGLQRPALLALNIRPAEQPVTLFRRDTMPAAGSRALWSDGLGRPVLSVTPQGTGARYYFHSRLHPAWSNLAESQALPALLLSLLQPEDASGTGPDQRALDPGQLPASSSPAVNPASPRSTAELLDLRPWFVGLAALVFALERWLAHRRSQPVTSAS